MDARDIMYARRGQRKTVDDFYHDDDNYYVVNGFKGSKASDAQRTGTIVNGRTGEVYNRMTASWEPDPRIERGRE